jgi:precorrin-8X/cobalt-precorrin-8 methylmutase
MGIGLILLSHGSRLKESTDRFLSLLVERSSFLLPPGARISVAHLQFGKPDLQEAVEGLARSGCRDILVLPFFLLPGRHPHLDVPRLVEEVSRSNPEINITLAPSLGEQPWMFEVVSRWILDAMPRETFPREAALSSLSGREIREKSLAFTRSIADGAYPSPGDGWRSKEVVARVVHATGDPSIAASLRFTPGAVNKGLSALLEKRAVIVDVKMVKVGVDSRLLEELGCPLHCAVEEAGEESGEHTKAYLGMRKLADKLEGALVAVGNAPTALLSLIDMVLEGVAHPSMVIGMPVGFVQAVEAKRRLLETGIPCVVVDGTRGGSPAAVATLNCLLDMAARASRGEYGSFGEPVHHKTVPESEKGGSGIDVNKGI